MFVYPSLPFTYFQSCAESFTPKSLLIISTSSFFPKPFPYFCAEVMVGKMGLEDEEAGNPAQKSAVCMTRNPGICFFCPPPVRALWHLSHSLGKKNLKKKSNGSTFLKLQVISISIYLGGNFNF